MDLQKYRIVLIALLCLCSVPASSYESEQCRKVYRDGGGLAVVASPHCPRWNRFLNFGPYDPSVKNCSEAVFTTLGEIFGDHRTFCDVEFELTDKASDGAVKDAVTGLVAVFNGYNNSKDTELAWESLTDFYFLHLCFLKLASYSGSLKEVLPESRDNSLAENIKGAMVRAVYDSTSSSKKQLLATVMVMIDEQMFMTSPGGSSVLVDKIARGGGRLPASLSLSEESFRRIKNVELIDLKMQAKEMINHGSDMNQNRNHKVSAYIGGGNPQTLGGGGGATIKKADA